MFDYKPCFPPLKFSIIRITYTLKVLCVANSDKNPLFSNYIHIVKLSVSNCVICFGYINAGKSRIISIFLAIVVFGYILLGLTQNSENSSQILANSIKFPKNLGNSVQNVQYFSQMATLFVAFPEYSGHSNQFATSLWGFS